MKKFWHPRCKHSSRARRAVAQLAFLGQGPANSASSLGLLLHKVANAIRFEHFWETHVRQDPDTVLVPSFARRGSKKSIWDIALRHATALGEGGLILEFGVKNGVSLRYFSENVPTTVRLMGFDSFEGIPEPWDSWPRGAIKGCGAPVELWTDPDQQSEVIEKARRGEFPAPPQENISIEVGLFSETVPRFLSKGVAQDIRLIHFDADLYMSTRPVLDSICGQIGYPYYVLFDELYSVNHEFRAWVEFVKFYNVSQWKVVAISEDGVQALFRVN